jgi:autotransporter-associated beta strand protein
MSSASQNLTINSAVTLGPGNQTWNVATGKTLTLGGTISRGTAGSLLIDASANTGTITASPTLTNSIVGPWAIVKSAGTVGNGLSGGFTFATVTAGNIAAYTGASSQSAFSYTSDVNANYDVSGVANVGNSRSANTVRYTGATATLSNNSSSASPKLTLNGLLNAGSGALTIQTAGGNDVNVGIGASNNLVLAAANAAITINGIISGSSGAGLTILGPNTITLTGVNTYTGTTYINSGTLSVNANNRLGSVSAPVSLNGGTLRTTTGFSNTHTVTVGPAGGAISVSSGQTLTFGVADSLLGAGQLNVSGGGTLVLSDSNSFSGNLTASSASDVLLNLNGQLSSGNYAGAINMIGGVLTFNTTANQTLTGRITGTGGSLVQQGANSVLTIAGTGNNSYSGGTTISGGELRANNSVSSIGSGTVTVGNGTNAATLGGNGTISNGTNAITINTNATITAGADSSNTGKLTTGDQVWKRGGQYTWKLANHMGTAGAVNGWDQLVMTTLNLTDLTTGSKFKIVAVGTGTMALQTGDTFQIASYTGTSTSAGVTSLASLFSLDVSQLLNQTANADIASDYGLSFTSTSVILSYNGPQAAPEPGVMSLVGLSGAALLGQRRRRRCVA